MFPKNSGYVATTNPNPPIRALIYAAKGGKRNEQALARATDAPRPTGLCFEEKTAERSRAPKQAPMLCLRELQRPLRARRSGCIAAARRRGLRPEAHLFGLADQFGEDKSETSQHQNDDDQACYRQYDGLDWLGPTPPIHCRLT